ncbi:MAG: putative manganese transporter [Paracoccaceae bacterium]
MVFTPDTRTTAAADIRVRPAIRLPKHLGPFRTGRLLIALALFAAAMFPGALGAVTRTQMIDAYVQVSAFVAATLLLFYGTEKLFRFDMGTAMRRSRQAQVPIAGVLGMTPGCGGAVLVVAAYSSGNVSLGAVVAALTATMGDAAFLLIAVRPDAAAVVLPLSLVVGVVSGYAVDFLERRDYRGAARARCDLAPRIGRTRARDYLYFVVFLPGIVLGLFQILQFDLYALFGALPVAVGLSGIAVSLLVWASSPLAALTNAADSPITRAAEETSFITIWVVFAYLAYEYVVAFGGFELKALFESVAVLLPLIGIVVGFIPGCGPQILVCTLYINGLVPFSALVGNAISNDGDALFPAIALNPRAAVMATAYSAVPALIVAYFFYFFLPGFLS